MTTHYHLVLQVPLGGLSAGMRLLNSGFSTRTNRRHDRYRHLFQNRFFSVELETVSHLLEACRYVVLNPVRAGMCASAGDWPWSS
jgi:putative transposase